METIKLKGYSNELLQYVLEKQLLDEDLMKLCVNQFRLHPDNDNGWRGEFWGKIVRGSCTIYSFTKNKKLYKVLKNTVLDLISTQEKTGRISSYPLEKEFTCWDMWGRKYVMLGLIYFYDICESDSLKKKIVKTLKRHADYILKHVGEGSKKISIFKTASIYGGLNSCSILSPMVRLYKITKDEKYLSFARYIVENGMCSTFNLIEASLDEKLLPFEFKETKAYEMMSCLNGLLDYYEFEKNEDYLNAATNFVKKLISSDYTIIGCCGNNSEFLDNSSITQTNYNPEFAQETCVTVTLMDLVHHLYKLTGDSSCIDIIENSAFNAYFGAFNNEKQTMKDSNGNVWTAEGCTQVPHESYAFDSYSPLFNSKRGKQVAGFMVLQDGRSYGCCTAIGSLGLGLLENIAVESSTNSLKLNIFDKYTATTLINDKTIKINMNADIYSSNKVKINLSTLDNEFTLKLRIPYWMKKAEIYVDNSLINEDVIDGYVSIRKNWSKNVVVIKYKAQVEAHYLNDKVAFTYGPIVLASDNRYNKDNEILGLIKNKKASAYHFKKSKDLVFKSNCLFEATIDGKKYYFVDYAQAGKNFDDKNSNVSVWMEVK